MMRPCLARGAADSLEALLIWSIAGLAIAGVLFRPRDWPEAVWACLGGALLVIFGLLPLRRAIAAVGQGTDVYLFLTGMMLLAELARREGVFDWLATLAVRAAKESRARLFALVYVVGIAVTVFLSNDATAVVLTPAVYAAVKRARTEALPYLFICAFIANAASFVLPISNPANLVVYGKSLPPLVEWLRVFGLASLVSIASTYVMLLLVFRKSLEGTNSIDQSAARPLSANGRRAGLGILACAVVLIGCSAFSIDLGLPTFLAGVAVVLATSGGQFRRVLEIAGKVSWAVLPLVAGLFVLVEGMKRAGALEDIGHFLEACSSLPRYAGPLAASLGIAGLSNVMNNLPSGLLAGSAVQAAKVGHQIRDAVLIAIDLGPNLSITGSLATLLWLIELRREGEQISGWKFLKVGALVMPPALILSCLAISWMG